MSTKKKTAKKIVKKAAPKAKKVVKAKPKKIVAKVAKKPKVSAMDTVYGIIGKNKKGVDTTHVKKLTRYNEKKIWNAINRLKKQGKIISAQKGVYVKIK